MYVLDTDTITAVLHNPTEYLTEQISSVPDQVFISIVVAEEMIRGVLNTLHSNRRTPQVTKHYDFLVRLISDLQQFPVLPYDDAAEAMYQTFSPKIRRVGLRDCRISASAMTRKPEQYIVVTRNLTDFETIGARCVNWIDRPASGVF